MPYIKPEDREFWDGNVNAVGRDILLIGEDMTPGELNYIITRLMIAYELAKGTSYQTYNDLMGVLACAGNELTEVRISPYEMIKAGENGSLSFNAESFW